MRTRRNRSRKHPTETAEKRGRWSKLRKYKKTLYPKKPLATKSVPKRNIKRSDISKELHRRNKTDYQEMTPSGAHSDGLRHAHKKMAEIGGGKKNPRW